MGQQQLLLIVLGIVVVGIAVAMGVFLFSGSNIQANKDAMSNEIMDIAANAVKFYYKPLNMGGGARSYLSYDIPDMMDTTDNASYTVSAKTKNTITILGTSRLDVKNTVEVTFDQKGRVVGSWTYTGDFE